VGAVNSDGDTLVSTGVCDATDVAAGLAGFEFWSTADPADTVLERSSLLTSRYYSPAALSEQDLVCSYHDFSDTVPEHVPLGLTVYQNAYVWSYPYTEDFVIISYDVVNVGGYDLTDLYVGLYSELVTANENWWGEDFNRTAMFRHKRVSYDSLTHNVYERNDGYDPLAVGYGAFKLLGTSPLPLSGLRISYNWWKWRDLPGTGVPDAYRYNLLSNGEIDPNVDDQYVLDYGYPEPILLLSCGPFPYLASGETLNVTVAFVCGLDSADLWLNSYWAQRAYDSRYNLPAPPPSPGLTVVSGNQAATLYWDASPEEARDPNSGWRDFEGYRVYRSETGIVGDASWRLLAQYDKTPQESNGDVDNGGGYNIGLPPKIQTGPYSGKYSLADEPLRNGFTYYFAVTSFDVGDLSLGLSSLESSARQNLVSVTPGTPPTSQEEPEIGVYPNPYRVHAVWDGVGDRARKLCFSNLPARSTIRIFTASGAQIRALEHDSPNSGEEAWDLISGPDQAVATGLYIASVFDHATGRTKLVRFVVIK
jgi:hypothetical protein